MEPHYRRDLEGWEQTLGRDHLTTLIAVSNMGSLLQDQGKLSLADPFFRRAVEGCERTLGRDHPHTLNSINNVGSLLKEQGKLKEAEPLDYPKSPKCK